MARLKVKVAQHDNVVIATVQIKGQSAQVHKIVCENSAEAYTKALSVAQVVIEAVR